MDRALDCAKGGRQEVRGYRGKRRSLAQLIGTVGSITTASLMMVLTSAAGAPSHPPGKLTLTAPFLGTTAPSQYLYY